MAQRDEIAAFLDDYLDVARIRDHGINGLQVEGKGKVEKVALGVSASLELFERAAEAGADMVIVHHGLFWSNSPREITNVMKQRLKTLFDHDITLLAYHLPLDSHPEIGNNAQIAKLLGLHVESGAFGLYDSTSLGVIGATQEPVSFTSFAQLVASALSVTPHVLASGPEMVSRIGIISGGAASQLHEAIVRECDVYLTGETGEPTLALAKEGHINFIGLGHYNSEKYGPIALGRLIEQQFGVATEFIDIPNPF